MDGMQKINVSSGVKCCYFRQEDGMQDLTESPI